MKSKWHTVRLGDVCQVNPDKRDSSWPHSVISYIDIASVGNGVLNEQPRTVLVAEAPGRAQRLVHAGDTIVSTVRPNRRSFLYVSEPAATTVVSTGFAVLRAGEALDPRFLYYLVTDQSFTDYLVAHQEGSAYPAVNSSVLGDAEVTIPKLPEQHSIGRILGALDDKIELNRRMNETLEAMARTLFKSWFIDFDPVYAKAEGRDPGLPADIAALFPDSFEDSELGEIPEGWRAAPIGRVAEVTIGGDWGEDTAFPGAVEAVCLRGVDLEHLRGSGRADAPRRWLTVSSIQKRSLCTRDVLIAASGAGPTGRSLWAALELDQVWGMPMVYSNFCKRLRCTSEALAVYLDRCLSTMRDSGEIWDYVNGTSVPNLDAGALLSGKMIVLPDGPILDAFAKLSKRVSARLFAPESRTLATLRDALLPKLLSGELRVRDVAKSERRFP